MNVFRQEIVLLLGFLVLITFDPTCVFAQKVFKKPMHLLKTPERNLLLHARHPAGMRNPGGIPPYGYHGPVPSRPGSPQLMIPKIFVPRAK
ncbi:hypothetical protein MTO96_038881 [Rhipicephalus appendiculatus]|uniref:Glycine rich superfamily member n=1 Tax=Rhipicephalus appendiculatus TaxID=34631 RepID=A0A131YF23_RHIAP